jgi:hypothetical protein
VDDDGTLEGAVVEDRAVLVDLDQGRAPVLGAALQDLGEVARSESMVRATNVASAPSASDTGLNGRRPTPPGGLGDLADLGGGGVLALGQAVDLVVEQQDRHVDVAAQCVDEVVAADRQGVAVAGDDPHRQVGTGVARPVAIAGARPWIECMP